MRLENVGCIQKGTVHSVLLSTYTILAALKSWYCQWQSIVEEQSIETSGPATLKYWLYGSISLIQAIEYGILCSPFIFLSLAV